MAPSPDQGTVEPVEADPLARFRNWRVFLGVSMAVNALFLYGMLGAVQDPGNAPWIKALSWLPFNVIATALYLVFMVKLNRADEATAGTSGGTDRAPSHGAFYVVLCVAMIAINWIVMFSAG